MPLTSSGAVFCAEDIIGGTLNESGYALALVHAYFDESIAHQGKRILCVAGYLVKASQTRRLVRQWRRALKRFHLPYFRMSACAHGNDPFKHLSLDQRIAVEKLAIEIIKQRTAVGFAVSVDVDEIKQAELKNPLLGSPYTFCLHWVLGGVYDWIEDAQYNGKIAYYFEAGHASQSEANRIMDRVFRVPEIRDVAKYAQHSFVDKKAVPAVQAADLLAWQWYTDLRHQNENKRRRKDLESLMLHPHKTFHVRKNTILQMKGVLDDIRDPVEFLTRFHLGDQQFRQIQASRIAQTFPGQSS